ncbi:hypothetical protein CSKR_203199 [Clonorchis sinensis]|uniref:Uncharacterized protein n=1 Tax=Clonorchis sinensis TaxID=79923 RepID=A0A8T1M9G8_CLOSI|nr:hypothetical protein CSKR_203199 [Clonorchis sinensis]
MCFMDSNLPYTIVIQPHLPLVVFIFRKIFPLRYTHCSTLQHAPSGQLLSCENKTALPVVLPGNASVRVDKIAASIFGPVEHPLYGHLCAFVSKLKENFGKCFISGIQFIHDACHL